MLTDASQQASTARWETLYFNGLQWTPVNCWNPYRNDCNNFMVLAQLENARVTVFETPYIYNMLTGEQFPLLAAGPYEWDDTRTSITFTLKTAAHWSDGTPVTAEDVAYTWSTHVKYGTSIAAIYQDYISSILPLSVHRVRITAKLDLQGHAINPLMLTQYLSSVYVIQKAWTLTLEARTNENPDEFFADPGEDFIASGPYLKDTSNTQLVTLIRDENYWGQDASMWGKLPSPKYLASVIYTSSNDALNAFKAGAVDVSQQFIENVQDLWLVDGLPVSTYLPEAPYNIGTSMPTAFYNLNSYGLDQLAVRKAIAMAVDYDQIVENAMFNQSATFTQVPRSLMNPIPGEQALYDHEAVKDLQWTGNDINGAKLILDNAGITDTNNDGWREYNGTSLEYVVTCPNGWSDWQAAVELIKLAINAIGIQAVASYPDLGAYLAAITTWPIQPGYDIFIMWTDGAGPAQPYSRIRHLMSSEYAGTTDNNNGNWGGYINPAADALIQSIPGETDPAVLKQVYTDLTEIYLTDIPSFSVMYRPQAFYTVNASVWKGFPHQGDGNNPPVPPLDLIDGYSIAGLYNLGLVRPYHLHIPLIEKH